MFICNMGKKVTLSEDEKAAIIKGLHDKQTTLKIAKTLNYDHRTIKKFVSNLTSFNGRSDKGKPRGSSVVSPRMVKRIYIKRNTPQPSPNEQRNFKAVGLPNKSKSTRGHILKSISKCGKPVARPPLKSIHREKRLKWAENNMKVNFENVIFMDECRATLDGPDGWSRGWYDAQ